RPGPRGPRAATPGGGSRTVQASQRARDLVGTPVRGTGVVTTGHEGEVDDHHARAQRDAAQREVVGELQRDTTDAGDQTAREPDHVDGVAEVDAVLHPD